MKNRDQKYFSVEFIEEDGKIYILFYDLKDNLVAKHKIPYQDITEAIRLDEENN